MKTVREEVVESSVTSALSLLRFKPTELALLRQAAEDFLASQVDDRESLRESLELRLGYVRSRMGRLTDLLIDDAIGKDIFEERKAVLLMERADIERQLGDLTGAQATRANRLREYLELLSRAQLLHEFANPSDRRDLLSELTSNRSVFPKNVVVELREPFHSVAAYLEMHRCDPIRDIPRTFHGVVDIIDRHVEAVEKRRKAIVPMGFWRSDFGGEMKKAA
jgi:hypothetical protein